MSKPKHIGPRLHPRHAVVEKARSELFEAWHKIAKKHDLTDGEYIRLAIDFAQDQIGGLARAMIRHERHGRGNRPGDAID